MFHQEIPMNPFVKILWLAIAAIVVVGGIYVFNRKIPAPATQVRKEIPVDLSQHKTPPSAPLQ